MQRIEEIARARPGERWIPDFLSLSTALENSRKDQTYNTPAIATLVLLARAGRLDARAGRPGRDGGPHHEVERHLYVGREPRARDAVRRRSGKRSLVVGTIDFDDEIDAAELAGTLRANGIVDVEPYRKLGRNQLRIAMFPAIAPSDVRGVDRFDRLGPGAEPMSTPKVLVAEKIGDSGIDLLREHFDVDVGVGVERRGARRSGSASTTGS